MEKARFFMNQENAFHPNYNNSSMFGMELQSHEMNCSSDQLPNSFFNPHWEYPMDQSDPFESALSSMVSSPVNSGAGIPIPGSSGESIVLRELIGRLGSICNSGENSPHKSYINGNTSTSTNTSCYNTPLNSPPKLNLSMMDYQIRGNLNLPISANHQLPAHPTLTPFQTDPGFAERAARFSCFGNQLGLKEPGKVPMNRVSSNQSFKVQENSDGMLTSSDKKFSRLSMPGATEIAELGDSVEESSVSDQITNNANARKRKSIPRGKGKETPPSTLSSPRDAKVVAEKEDKDAKRSKSEGEEDKKKEEGGKKQTKEISPKAEPPKDYIHVRARRGQATDSHSLAERVRREKISERMKFLQDLVPGCNKVTGKAVMLDEIINYVQSLQRQVEFLSMKLATVNPTMDLNMEALLSKDIFQSRGSMMQNMYPLDTSAHPNPYAFQSQHNGKENPFSTNLSTVAIHRNLSMKMPHIDNYNQAASQVSTIWENDLQSVVQMGLGQIQSESFHGQMKPEL